MFTGGFVDKSRSELKSLAESLGAKIVSNVSKKTDFLITGSHKPTTRKINEAKNLNIKISKLAQGLPVGGEIESLDDGTLISAFKNRKGINKGSD